MLARLCARLLLRPLAGKPVSITLWNGTQVLAGAEAPRVGITIADAGTLCRLVLDPSVAFGEGYSEGKIKVEGDLALLLEWINEAADPKPQDGPSGPGSRATRGCDALRRFWWHSHARWSGNSVRRSRTNVHRHYDLGNDFYQLWLDSNLLYTCAYFPARTQSLEEAQVAKMDYICRKLRLQPGENVVEAGCGWGALALHMARYYGVVVKAFNVSREQILYARTRAREEGLESRVEFVEEDYRGISGRYDAFVSVGMLEHVGLPHYSELGEVIHRVLGKDGRGFLHFIGRDRERMLDRWIRKYIFPGAYIPTLTQVAHLLEPNGFSILDVENLRLHYARTLECWLERFEQAAGRVSARFDEQFTRTWRLYLAGSLAAFRSGLLQLFQVSFARSGSNQISWTRAYLYEPSGERRDKGALGRRSEAV